MKRSLVRNSTYLGGYIHYVDLNRNVVYPSLYFGPDDISKQSSVEIKELRSDEDSDNEQPDDLNHSHVWCYNDEEQESNYKINKEARERRRHVQNENNEIYNELFDQMCTEFYGIDCHSSFDGAKVNQDKGFTIIKNNPPYDTSSDEEYDVVENDDTFNINDIKNEKYCADDLVKYSNGFREKRTIWIFSEKNRSALSGHDYGLINIPDIDSSSTITEDEEPTRDINVGSVRRLATPIPTYIPKLCLPLSPTLPTVTEVVETNNKSSSNVSETYNKTVTPQMPRNNWVQEIKTANKETGQECTANNSQIMPKNTLTPREKRRLKNNIDNKTFTINEIIEVPIVSNSLETDVTNPDVTEKVIKISQLNEPNVEKNTKDDVDSKSSSEELPNYLQKPQIKVNRKTKPHSEIITEPLEKPDGNWIGDEAEKTSEIYNYDKEMTSVQRVTAVDIDSSRSVANKFSVANMALMKPAAWTQYLPITGSVPSLHLSFETNYESETKSCLKKFFKYVNCCRK
ncbi:hypothetical protein KGM_208015 [Danaus plexippus plexippus]|uniref:Uncharacterized protein n=1 Tax=Danaus plexippus plexippus TaxID=278856 RepID=A0A212F5Y4_DANPL|nr:hypothetical protein KGM_208015 [Danaus plexippus plexippus]